MAALWLGSWTRVRDHRGRSGDRLALGRRETPRELNPQSHFQVEGEQMDTKRLVVGTIVGGIVLYAVGYLIFIKGFGDFYAANAGTATGVDRGAVLVWATVLGNLAYAALITFVIGNRAGPLSIGAGARIGAIVGFLLWFTADFIFYGYTNVANLTRTVVDPLLEIVHGGIAGAAIVAVFRRMPASGRIPA